MREEVKINRLKTEQRGRDVIITGVSHFDLSQTLDCGQAFRWSECEDGSFSGIAHGRRLDISLDQNELALKNCTVEEFHDTWKNYFGFGRDYEALREEFAGEENLIKALEFSPGLRLMRQDTWETLVSFILSQHTNIPRIKKMVTTLCETLGNPLPCGGFTFPTPEKIASANASDLAPIKAGYRTKYVIDAACQVAGKKIDLTALEHQPTADVKKALLSILGVGPKVADCVLLYGFGREECYPVDVWIKRAMTKLYPGGFPDSLKNQAGIAQLFLFHYIRHGGEAPGHA